MTSGGRRLITSDKGKSDDRLAAGGLAAGGARSDRPILSGAEAVAEVLAAERVGTVFGYPGTSELALCAAVERRVGIVFVNARGDREAAFMAGGASLLCPAAGAAILHGARGSTNACGAIADLRRNEIGTLLLVGLPSTKSARFLPPHGEPDLIEGLGRFAKDANEAKRSDTNSAEDAQNRFVRTLRDALAGARASPPGPTLLGIPQDLLEERWIRSESLDQPYDSPVQAAVPPLREAYAALTRAQRCVIIVDDYLLKDRAAVGALTEFAGLVGAPVFQVRYLRGPMLFERLSQSEVPSFAGWYDPRDPTHRDVLGRADLLITLEDRNMYERVVGALPACPKLAITSDAAKARKNGYLRTGDVVLEGTVGDVLLRLVDLLRAERPSPSYPSRLPPNVDETRIRSSPGRESPTTLMRSAIGAELGRHFRSAPRPVLIEDGQMLGGLLADVYDQFPHGLRVFGDHGGFVGAGIAYATGMALQEPEATVTCTLGDQSLTNGLQSLVSAGECQAPVIYLVCNNGESVSLRKQLEAIETAAPADRSATWLQNAPTLDYGALARACGIGAAIVEWRPGIEPQQIDRSARELRAQLDAARASDGPQLIELRLPPLGEAWTGIWITEGFDEGAGAPASSYGVARRRPRGVSSDREKTLGYPA